MTDQDWLDRAVALATENVAADGGPFAAIVVRNGELLAVGMDVGKFACHWVALARRADGSPMGRRHPLADGDQSP